MRAPWTWACLPCDVTGTGSAAAHRCALPRAPWRRDFWIERFRLAMPRATTLEIEKTLDRPITRDEMVRVFGERWRPDVTAPLVNHAGARKEAA